MRMGMPLSSAIAAPMIMKSVIPVQINGFSIIKSRGNATSDAAMFANTPPRLYIAVGISSVGRSGGASRHCPPVPAMEKRLVHNLPSFFMNAMLKMRNETKR